MLLNVSGEISAHDPTIVKENGIYYRFQTGNLLEYYSSANLLVWKKCAAVFKENPFWCSQKIPGSDSLWAPEIVWRGGEWRVYYSVSIFGSCKSAIGYAASKSLNPYSPDCVWQDRGFVLLSSDDSGFNAIDPNVVQDFEGNDWLLWGSFWGGLKLRAMNAGGTLCDTQTFTLASRCVQPNPVEGGFIFPYGGLYYLFASHDFCCRGTESTYKIVYGASEKITGPYLDQNGNDMAKGGGTVLRDGSNFECFAGPGHNSIFRDDDGKTYIVYHAYDRNDGGKFKLMIEPIFFEGGIVKL